MNDRIAEDEQQARVIAMTNAILASPPIHTGRKSRRAPASSNNQAPSQQPNSIAESLGKMKLDPTEPGEPGEKTPQNEGNPDTREPEVKTNVPSNNQTMTSEEIERELGAERCTLFIGDLARSCTDETLNQTFSKCGEVVMVDIKRDKISHNVLGYGFVQMKTREEAVKAKQELQGVELDGRRIRIGWAQRNTTLFVGDLDASINSEDLLREFGAFGQLVPEETFVKHNQSKGSNFGFVRFLRRADAEKAKSAMNRKILGSRPIRIGWGDHNTQKHIVHVQFSLDQLMSLDRKDLNEDDFRHVFQSIGDIASINIPRSFDGSLRGYAFVNFQESQAGEDNASKAISTLSGVELIPGLTIKCSYGKRQVRRRGRQSSMQQGHSQPPNVGSPHHPHQNMYNAWMMSMPNHGMYSPVHHQFSPTHGPPHGVARSPHHQGYFFPGPQSHPHPQHSQHPGPHPGQHPGQHPPPPQHAQHSPHPPHPSHQPNSPEGPVYLQYQHQFYQQQYVYPQQKQLPPNAQQQMPHMNHANPGPPPNQGAPQE